jgi:hypothetical protein
MINFLLFASGCVNFEENQSLDKRPGVVLQQWMQALCLKSPPVKAQATVPEHWPVI